MKPGISLFLLDLAFPMRLWVRIPEMPRNLYFNGSPSTSVAQPDLGTTALISYFPSMVTKSLNMNVAHGWVWGGGGVAQILAAVNWWQ